MVPVKGRALEWNTEALEERLLDTLVASRGFHTLVEAINHIHDIKVSRPGMLHVTSIRALTRRTWGPEIPKTFTCDGWAMFIRIRDGEIDKRGLCFDRQTKVPCSKSRLQLDLVCGIGAMATCMACRWCCVIVATIIRHRKVNP
jgi:hypothetical protein